MTEYEHIHGLSQRGMAEWFETHMSCSYCPMINSCGVNLEKDCIDMWEEWLNCEYDPEKTRYANSKGLERGLQKLCKRFTNHRFRECWAFADYRDVDMPVEYHWRCRVCGYKFWNYNKPTLKQTRDSVVREHIENDKS